MIEFYSLNRKGSNLNEFLTRLEDGIPIQIFREIRTLQHCSESKEPGSECILRLRSYFAAGSAVVLATDFMLGDLGEIIRNWENPLRSVFDC